MPKAVTLEMFPEMAIGQPAQNCASSGTDGNAPQCADFANLEDAARRMAKKVIRMGRLYQDAWDELLPILDAMQKLLSQRGADHSEADAGLPEWGAWWADFSTKNCLNISFRTVQDRLRKFRKEPRSRGLRRPGATYSEQNQLMATVKLAHRLAAAIQMGEDIDEALDTFLRDGLPLERVDQIEERLVSQSDESDPTDRAALAKTIIRMAGPQIRSFLTGLSPIETRDVLQSAFSRIVGKFCGGEIDVRVEYSAGSISPAKTDLITMPIDHHAA
jgi:hypothetical protein